MSLPSYSEYKHSGVEWLGTLPAHWDVVRLKAVARLLTEKTGHGRNPVGLENIQSWSGQFATTESEFEGDGVAFEPGDILFGKLRPYLAKVWLADAEGEAVGDFHVLRPVSRLQGRFTQYQMLNRNFIEVIDGSTFGSKMPRASWESLGSMPFVVPAPGEQRAIAIFLDRETAKIDALIAEQERIIAVLTEKRQATIFESVTRGIDPTAATRDSSGYWFSEVPKHWDVCRIKDVARLESGHTPSKQIPEYWEDCNIPWVSLNDSKELAVQDYISDTAVRISELGLANSSARMLPAGSVVFTRDATIGLAAITTIPMAVSQHLIAWCPSGRMEPLFLLRVLNAMRPFLDSYTFGATIKTIGMADVKKLVAPVPPIEEQQKILGALEAEIAKLVGLQADSERAVALLKERRAALITAAVTGQIDVRGLVNAFEPTAAEEALPA